jgi:putative tryptophan/tyrosine transport system substrate-binding protein
MTKKSCSAFSWFRSDNRKTVVSYVESWAIQNQKLLGLSIIVFVLAAGAMAQAQQTPKIPHVGILFIGGREQPHLEAFKQGLQEHGYSEGKNIVLEYRYAEGQYDRLPDLAKEFVREKVDVIVTTSSISAQAARKATRTIPIVMTTGSPVEQGLAESLARPGGNVTGLSVLVGDLSGKRVELLKEAFPKITGVLTLWSPRSSEAVIGLKETQEAARALAVKLHPVKVQTAEDIEKAFAELPKANVKAVLVVLSPQVTLESKRIVELALKQRLPGMYPTRQFAEEGGLMAYGPLIGDLYRRAAAYVDKIPKGAKPANIPVEQPRKFEFVINLKAAKQIGLTIPPTVLARADKVIR